MKPSLPATSPEWREWKLKELAAGRATLWDRKTAARIRRRQREGYLTSEAQLEFAAKVERIANND